MLHENQHSAAKYGHAAHGRTQGFTRRFSGQETAGDAEGFWYARANRPAQRIFDDFPDSVLTRHLRSCMLYHYNNTVRVRNVEAMLLQIDHHSGQPIYRQVIDQIRRQVMAGQLRAGEALPSVRDLAAQLRVNPMTISKAYSLLEREGLLERRRGVGLFVAALRKDQASRTKTDMLEEALTKAIVTAVQLDIPEEQAREMLTRLYHKYDSKMRRRHDE